MYPLLSHLKRTFVQFNLQFQCFDAGELPIDLNLTGANIKSTKFKETSKMPVMPAEAGIQRLKSLDPGQKHAGMTIMWDSSAMYPRLVFSFVLLISSFTTAASGYLGINFGTSWVDADLSSIGGGAIDESTGMSKFYGGVRSHQYVAFEVAYFNLSRASVSTVGAPPNDVSGSVDMSALGLYGVVYVPIAKRSQVLVKAGGASWEADIQRDAVTAKTDGLDMFYGLGISYSLNRSLAITADWEVIDAPNPELSTLSLGFRWDFN